MLCDFFHFGCNSYGLPEKGKNIKKRYKREKYKMRNTQLIEKGET